MYTLNTRQHALNINSNFMVEKNAVSLCHSQSTVVAGQNSVTQLMK
uniref:Uncharacterized protein n=1 Tax=Anguilla anguilla TaxID=7936 RepID=A0A0E9P7N5_ANGAN